MYSTNPVMDVLRFDGSVSIAGSSELSLHPNRHCTAWQHIEPHTDSNGTKDSQCFCECEGLRPNEACRDEQEFTMCKVPLIRT